MVGRFAALDYYRTILGFDNPAQRDSLIGIVRPPEKALFNLAPPAPAVSRKSSGLSQGKKAGEIWPCLPECVSGKMRLYNSWVGNFLLRLRGKGN